jgi:RNA polymerase subunit RPABC4/transcription elongation factor Spt4
MHAHKCTVCESRGITTIWIHGDNNVDQKSAHKCPKCGSENWAKYMVEVGQIPKIQQQQQGTQLVQVLTVQDALTMAFTYAILVMLIAIVAQNWERIISYISKSKA